MAETLEDQLYYGRTCVHGRNVGTPGGYDILCGDCEMGYTKWVDEPLFQLQSTWEHPNESRPVTMWADGKLAVYYRRGEWEHRNEWADAYMDRLRNWGEIAGKVKDSGGTVTFQMVQVDAGYWDTP